MKPQYHRQAIALVLSLPALFMAAGPAGAQAVKVKMGSSLSPPSLDSITPYVAVEQGLFKKYGLDVEIIEFRGDATHTKALLAGEVGVAAVMGPAGAIVAASKGAKIRLWMVPQPVSAYRFVARRAAGATIQALAGRTVAVSGIGAGSHQISRVVLERNGMDPDKLNYVVVGSPADRFRALVTGKIDATLVTETEFVKLERFPDVVSLAQVSKVAPEIPYEFAMAREDYLEKHPETVSRLTKALIEANRWIAANKAGTVEVALRIVPGETAEVLGKAYDSTDPRLWGVNGDLTEAAYRYSVNLLLKVGHLQAPVPFDKFFDRRFVDRALKDLGRM